MEIKSAVENFAAAICERMEMDSAAVLLRHQEGPIRTLTLNRPHAHNAIDPEMASRLADAFEAFAADDDSTVLIVTGSKNSFCSGGDLKKTLPLLTGARVPRDEWDSKIIAEPTILARAALRGVVMEKPVIAAVNGLCLAGGMELLLGCDIRIASTDASFGLPEVRLGLIPFAGALVRLPRQIAHCMAMEMLLTGKTYSAQEALSMGLINTIVPPDQVLSSAKAVARRIAENGPIAVREVKRTVMAAFDLPSEAGFALEDAARTRVMRTADAREGPAAFSERRKPSFDGLAVK